jgi:hypothetical protein
MLSIMATLFIADLKHFSPKALYRLNLKFYNSGRTLLYLPDASSLENVCQILARDLSSS